MIQQIMNDIFQSVSQYFGVNAVMVSVAGLLLWLVAVRKKKLSTEKGLTILVFLGYLFFVAELTLLNREAGSRVGISLRIWETYASDLYAQCWMVENVLLFIPFGILLPMLGKRLKSGTWIAAVALICSLGIEMTQLLTRRGFFQVDDIWLNLLGAMLGYGIWYLAQSFGTVAVLCLMVFLFLWGMIFGFSAQDGAESGSLSSALAKWVSVSLLRWTGWEISAQALEYPIRKTAHMTEYALLWLDTYGMLWFGKTYRYRRKARENQPAKQSVGFDSFCLGVSIAIVFLTSASDEFHQLFVPGRAGRVVDIGWDMLGAAICMLCFGVWTNHRRRKWHSPVR